MWYESREAVERIGRAGAYFEDCGDYYKVRMLSSFWLCVEKDDTAFTPHCINGENYWESWVTCWISQQLDKHELFVDVGANVGYYSFMAAASGMDVYAVEPNPAICELLRKSSRLNAGGVVSVFQRAASDSWGTAHLNVPVGHSGGASLGDTGIEVETITLDGLLGYVPEEGLLIKIDAEGSEPLIIAGMQEILKKQTVTITLEWESSRYDAEAFAKTLFAIGPVSLIEYDGSESRFETWQQLVALNELRMIVVRNYE